MIEVFSVDFLLMPARIAEEGDTNSSCPAIMPGAVLDEENARALALLLQSVGIQDVDLQLSTSRALYLSGRNKTGQSMVLKFRITNSEETLQLVRREADFFIQANQKRLKGVGTLLYSLPCGVGSMQFAAKLIWGDAHFAILAMRSWSLNGTDVQSSVHNCLKQSGGDIPDMARHLMRELLKIFSALHEKSMALGGNDWTGMALCHGQKLVLIEAGHALVVKENRNYVIPAVHAKASGPEQPQHLRPEDVESATLQSINLKLTDRNLCVLNGDGYFGPDLSETNLLDRYKRHDKVAIALNTLSLLVDKKFDNSLVDQLVSAGTISNLANLVGCSINEAQKPCVARLFQSIHQLLQGQHAAHVLRGKGAQLPLLTSKQASLAWGPGIPVPRRVVPELIDRETGLPEYTADLLLQHRDKKRGLGVILSQDVRKGELVTLYAGDEVDGLSKYCLPVGHKTDVGRKVDGICSPKWPFQRYIDRALVGQFMNSSRRVYNTRAPGNVRADWDRIFTDKDGVIHVPFIAVDNLNVGQELVWCYDWRSQGFGNLDEDSPSDEEFDPSVGLIIPAATQGAPKVRFPDACRLLPALLPYNMNPWPPFDNQQNPLLFPY